MRRVQAEDDTDRRTDQDTQDGPTQRENRLGFDERGESVTGRYPENDSAEGADERQKQSFQEKLEPNIALSGS